MEPEAVCTTPPSAASPPIGEVVITSPSLKLGDPLILPEIDPSRFFFQLEIVGTPRGAEASFSGWTTGLDGASNSDFGVPRPNSWLVEAAGITGVDDATFLALSVASFSCASRRFSSIAAMRSSSARWRASAAATASALRSSNSRSRSSSWAFNFASRSFAATAAIACRSFSFAWRARSSTCRLRASSCAWNFASRSFSAAFAKAWRSLSCAWRDRSSISLRPAETDTSETFVTGSGLVEVVSLFPKKLNPNGAFLTSK